MRSSNPRCRTNGYIIDIYYFGSSYQPPTLSLFIYQALHDWMNGNRNERNRMNKRKALVSGKEALSCLSSLIDK